MTKRRNLSKKKKRNSKVSVVLVNSTEPPLKKSRNGTLDDPLDDISRDSYASRGSDHSDGFTSKDNRFAVSVPSPTTPGQLSVPGLDSGAPSPANNLFDLEATSNQFDSTQPKRKRRKKQIESEFNRKILCSFASSLINFYYFL